MFWWNILGPKNISENIFDRKKTLKKLFCKYILGKINLANSLANILGVKSIWRRAWPNIFGQNLYDIHIGQKCLGEINLGIIFA